MRQLCNDRAGNVSVSLRLNENLKSWRVEQLCDEFPCHRYPPWSTQGPWVRGDAKEFVENRPRGEPRIRPSPLPLKPVAARVVELRIFVGRMHQYIRVDSQH